MHISVDVTYETAKKPRDEAVMILFNRRSMIKNKVVVAAAVAAAVAAVVVRQALMAARMCLGHACVGLGFGHRPESGSRPGRRALQHTFFPSPVGAI